MDLNQWTGKKKTLMVQDKKKIWLNYEIKLKTIYCIENAQWNNEIRNK